MSVEKRFLRFVSQNVMGMIGISCYILADTFFISVSQGADGITALNLVLPLYALIYAIGAMTGTGSATGFRILGARGCREADGYFSNAVFFALILSLPFMLAGGLMPERIISLLGGDERIVAAGADYTRIFMLFSPCFMLNYIFNAFVRNDESPSLAMAATLSGSFFNIIFDYILMFPCGMGMAGAALATGLSPIVGIMVCSLHFASKKNTVRFVWRRPSIKRFIRSAQLGVTAFVGELASGVMTTVFNFIILSLAGNTGVAAYGIVANVSLVGIAVFNGISQGAQPLVSEYYGKNDAVRLKKVLRLGIAAAAAAAVVMYALVYIYAPQLTAVFNRENSAELADYAVTGIRLYFTAFIFAGFNIVGTGYLGAAAKSAQAFIASVVRGAAAIIAFAFLLSALFGMTGVWLSFAAAEAATAVLTAVFIFVKK